ncbi:MAG: glycosyltransferase [Actinomycetota bacterium]|nr:glycosyltransferase [Actinomycetota bacterium]
MAALREHRAVGVSIAFVARRWTDEGGASTYVANALRSLADTGERVLLVTPDGVEGVQLPAAAMLGVERASVPDLDPRVRYFTEVHRYSDRVYQAIEEVTRRDRVDAVVFGHERAEGFTTVRAKRMLGRFADTRLVVVVQTPATLVRQAVGYGVTDFSEEIRLYAEDYVVAHADVVVTPTAALDRWVRERFGRPTVRIDPPLTDECFAAEHRSLPAKAVGDQVRQTKGGELVFLGALTPAKGADLFVAAAERIVARAPGFRFRVHGLDTPTDPFGRSYRVHLEARLPPSLRGRLTFHDPLPLFDPGLGGTVPTGTLCLFPARCDHAPYELLRAMRSGATVIVSRHEGVAELVDDGVSGRVVDAADPDAVADAVLSLHCDDATRRRLGESACAASDRGTPTVFRARLLAACGLAPAPPVPTAVPGDTPLWSHGPPAPDPTGRPTPAAQRPRIAGGSRAGPRSVSVVIPVFEQVHYLRETVASVQASYHDDLEIVVVDDGSTDPQVDQVLQSLGDDVVVVRRTTNGGVAAARNFGIAASSGRFVMPLDGDDLIDATYVPKALEALLRHPELSYVGCYSQNFGLLDTTYVPVGYVPNLMLFLHTDGRCTKLFDRTAIEAVGGYDDELPAFEDWDLYLRLAKHGFAGDVLPEALFRYRRHRKSTVFSWSNDIRIELLQYLVRKHRDLLAERYDTVVLHLLHLWKTYYEVSESVLLQAQLRAAPPADHPLSSTDPEER